MVSLDNKLDTLFAISRSWSWPISGS
jgi:hypothetical protein